VWKAFLTEYFPHYWLFGIGFDIRNIVYAIADVNGIGHGAHNIIIDILASSGIYGLFLYLSLFVKTTKEVRISARKDCSALLPFAMLICIIFTGIGENVVRGRLFWFSVALCIIFATLINKEQNNSKEKSDD
jgi:O-antigen ligase